MQDSLFPDDGPDDPAGEADKPTAPDAIKAVAPEATEAPAKPPAPSRRKTASPAEVHPAAVVASDLPLAARLPEPVRLGTSSWNYPGWAGLVWDGEYADTILSRRGLAAYAQHPLFRTVSLDRAFYRPLTVAQYAAYADQVPADFRFVVKAPSVVTDAMVRSEDGRGTQANTAFLDPLLAVQDFVAPALEGLGPRLGALVFQLSPLPATLLADMPGVLDRLAGMLGALPELQAQAPDAVIAIEVRDPIWIGAIHGPAFIQILKRAGATFCMGLHPKMPPIEEQLEVLRALWPGPLVCRWNVNRLHGRYGYEEAKQLYMPFDRIVDPDLDIRERLSRVAAATAAAGHNVFVTVSNKAEGSAPLTVRAFAECVAEAMPAAQERQRRLDARSDRG